MTLTFESKLWEGSCALGLSKTYTALGKENMSENRTDLVLIVVIDDNFTSFVEDRSSLRQNGLQNCEQTLQNERNDLLRGTVQGLYRYLKKTSMKFMDVL